MVLIPYATTHGSTAEVAAAVAEALRGEGLKTDVLNAKSARIHDSHSAVVLGIPLYMFRFHKDARRFLTRNRKGLENIPVAVFALGPINDVEKEWTDARAQLDKELAKYPWLTPVSVEIFGGKFVPSALRMPYKLIPALKQLGDGDIRDWDAIQNWAKALPAALKL